MTSRYNVPMGSNDADASTTGEYLAMLAKGMWEEKRPFGNSGWHYELAEAWGDAGLLPGYRKIFPYEEEDDYFELEFDHRELESLFNLACKELADPASNADHALDFTPEGALNVVHPPLCVKIDCKISKAIERSWLPEPDNVGRYPLWLDVTTGELEYDESKVYPF